MLPEVERSAIGRLTGVSLAASDASDRGGSSGRTQPSVVSNAARSERSRDPASLGGSFPPSVPQRCSATGYGKQCGRACFPSLSRTTARQRRTWSRGRTAGISDLGIRVLQGAYQDHLVNATWCLLSASAIVSGRLPKALVAKPNAAPAIRRLMLFFANILLSVVVWR